jgi:hypothetical protein
MLEVIHGWHLWKRMLGYCEIGYFGIDIRRELGDALALCSTRLSRLNEL